MTWLVLLRSRAAQIGGAVLAALLVLATFGQIKKREGRKDALDEVEDKDRERADAVRDRVRSVDNVPADDLEYRD